MATITNNGGTGSSVPYTNASPRIMEAVFDTAATITSGTTPGATDTIQVINVPANSIVLRAGFEVLTVESGNATAQVSLGDGGDVDRYVAATTVVATGQKTSLDANTIYTSADTIDLTSSIAALTNAKIRVWALVLDMDGVAVNQTLTFS